MDRSCQPRTDHFARSGPTCLSAGGHARRSWFNHHRTLRRDTLPSTVHSRWWESSGAETKTNNDLTASERRTIQLQTVQLQRNGGESPTFTRFVVNCLCLFIPSGCALLPPPTLPLPAPPSARPRAPHRAAHAAQSFSAIRSRVRLWRSCKADVFES